MAVTVVGSVAFDALETPFGKRDKILGGAATHFSLAASFFTDVRVVGVVGEDFGDDELAVFERRGDRHRRISSASRVPTRSSGRVATRTTCRSRETLDTQLNVFADFDPVLSPAARASEVVFLANIQPDLQRRVREQCPTALLTGLDSMNYWIQSARESLLQTMGRVDVIVLNDAEVRMLTGEPNLTRGIRQIKALGPRIIVVKQGSYGACVFTDDGFFFVPGYPLETVVDPTGAGDAFAGGLFGYLDHQSESLDNLHVLRCAVVYGSVLASFAIEEFGSERLQKLTLGEIESRFEEFKRMTHFEPVPLVASASGALAD